MSPQVRDDIEKKGFAVLRGYIPGASSLVASHTIGNTAVLPNVSNVQILKPRTQTQSSPNTYSGNFGLDEFPLHTDLAHWFIPPRYLVLRCVCGTKDVATYLFDSRELISEFGEITLYRVLVRPRRPIEQSNFILRLYDSTDNREKLFRWDSLFIRPATESSVPVYESVLKRLFSVTKIDIALESTGDTLIIDNWRMLHGRSAIIESEKSRHIERTYLRKLK